MRLVFAGTPEVAVPALDALLASRHDVVGVVTRPDARAGRGRHEVASPVARRAAEAGLEVLKPAKPSEPEFLARLAALEPDCCPVVAYGALVPRAALDVPRHGWVNLHFSLLPAWRGAAPVQHAVMAGDDMTGATTFVLEEGLDTGPVLGVVTEPVRPRDTSGDLLTRLAVSGARLLAATMDGVEDGALVPRPQPAEGVSTAPKITVEDARVDWSAPALAVDRRIRGCTPAPGAWTTFRGERLKLGPVHPCRQDGADDTGAGSGARDTGAARGSDAAARLDGHAPGTLVVDRAGVHVQTGSGPVALGDVQPQGRKRMPAADWARGVRPGPDERLT